MTRTIQSKIKAFELAVRDHAFIGAHEDEEEREEITRVYNLRKKQLAKAIAVLVERRDKHGTQ